MMSERSKRKVENDDELFSYSNTIEFSFGKKPKLISNAAKNRPEFERDSDSSSGDSSLDSDEEDSKWKRTEIVSEDDSGSELEEIESKNDSQNKSLEIQSPSPPPPPKLDPANMFGQRRNTKSSRALNKALLSLYNEKYNKASPVNPTSNERSPGDILIIDDSPKTREIMIKIKCHGIVNKYKIKQNEPFKNIINKIAQKENSSPENVLLYLGEESIRSQDTPSNIGCTVADIIECMIAVENKDDQLDIYDEKIKIKIQTKESNSKREYFLRKSSTLESVVSQYCKDRKIGINSVMIYFDGELVSLQNTPSELDMDDENIVDLTYK